MITTLLTLLILAVTVIGLAILADTPKQKTTVRALLVGINAAVIVGQLIQFAR